MAATVAHFLYHEPVLSVDYGRFPVVWSLQVSAGLIEEASQPDDFEALRTGVNSWK